MRAWLSPEEVAPDSCGFVFAASGAKYSRLAEQAAASLKQSNPSFDVDIYTDSVVEGRHFDKVFPLWDKSFRPKFEALLRSRFDRSIYLDCDLFVCGDLSDIFWVLSKFELAATHAPIRNAGFATAKWRHEIPNSFPQINGGLLGVKRNANTHRFVQECRDSMLESGSERDQVIIRELLWVRDIRLAILPPEYNVRDDHFVLVNGSSVPAPRVLHSYAIARKMRADGKLPSQLEIYGDVFLSHCSELIEADRQLNPGTELKVASLPVGALRRVRERISDSGD